MMNAIRRFLWEQHVQRQRRRWLRMLRNQGVVVGSDIEVLGNRSDYDTRFIAKPATHLERDITIWMASEAEADPVIDLGSRVYIGRNCYLGSFAPIQIGDDTIIGAYSYLISANHRYSSRTVPIRDQGYDSAPIRIGNDVWIGCHVTILAGVTICDGAVIGAGAVVTKDINRMEIWGGVPARKLNDRPNA